MNLDEHKEDFEIYGALNYTPYNIAIAMNLTVVQTALLFKRLENPKDELAEAYYNGKVRGAAKTELALIKLAWRGEKDAVEALSELKKGRLLEQLKKELFGL